MNDSAASSGPVRDFLAACVAEGRTPGAAWWVGSDAGVISAGALGWAALEPSREPITAGTPFDLASLTKPLSTAILAAALAEDGALDLDRTVGSYVPEVAESPYASATLLDLGRHGAGLPAWRPLFLEASTPTGYAGRIAREPRQVSEGGTLYSDLGYLLLGFAMERVTGRPLDALFDDRVARPLGLRRTGYAGTGGRFGDAAATERGNAHERGLVGEAGRGHPWRKGVIRGAVHDANAWGLAGVAGHAGLFGTAEETARIALGVLHPQRLGLDPSLRNLWLRPAAGEGARAFGWMPLRDSESVRGILEEDAVGHFGFTGTSVWLEPRRGRVYVLLTNRVHPDVPREEFTEVRRGFHAAAAALGTGGSRGGGAGAA